MGLILTAFRDFPPKQLVCCITDVSVWELFVRAVISDSEVEVLTIKVVVVVDSVMSSKACWLKVIVDVVDVVVVVRD